MLHFLIRLRPNRKGSSEEVSSKIQEMERKEILIVTTNTALKRTDMMWTLTYPGALSIDQDQEATIPSHALPLPL